MSLTLDWIFQRFRWEQVKPFAERLNFHECLCALSQRVRTISGYGTHPTRLSTQVPLIFETKDSYLPFLSFLITTSISPSALMSATKLRYYTLEHLTWLDRRSIYSSTWADVTAANRRMGRCQVSLSVVHTYIAPSLSVWHRVIQKPDFFFLWYSAYQGAPAHARIIHTLWIKFKDTCIHPGQPEFPMPGTPSPTQPSTHQRRQNQTVHGKLQKKKKEERNHRN